MHPIFSFFCYGCLHEETQAGNHSTCENAGRGIVGGGGTGLGGLGGFSASGSCAVLGGGGHSSRAGRGFVLGLGILGALGSAVPVVLAGLLAIRIGGVVLDALSEGLLAHEVRKGVLVLGDIRGLAILTLASEGEFFL